jgi:hypothetical protein
MSMKNSSDTIGNRTCDLPPCTAVRQKMRQRETLSDIYAETGSLEKGGKEIRKDIYKKQDVVELQPRLKRRTIQTG